MCVCVLERLPQRLQPLTTTRNIKAFTHTHTHARTCNRKHTQICAHAHAHSPNIIVHCVCVCARGGSNSLHMPQRERSGEISMPRLVSVRVHTHTLMVALSSRRRRRHCARVFCYIFNAHVRVCAISLTLVLARLGWLVPDTTASRALSLSPSLAFSLWFGNCL